MPADVKPKLLQAHLNEKGKLMIVWLTRDQLSGYDRFKEFLLNGNRVTRVQLRERFFSLTKKPDENHVNLASKLHYAWMYYVRSRNSDNNVNDLVSLICGDRQKDWLPCICFDWILM